MAIQINMNFDTDLNGGVQVTTLKPIFFTGDSESHCFIIKGYRNNVAESFAGATVKGYFIRGDEATVVIGGLVNDDGCAVVALPANCYAVPGRFQVVVRVEQNGVMTTVFCGDGCMRRSSTDTVVDGGEQLLDIAALNARIDSLATVATTGSFNDLTNVPGNIVVMNQLAAAGTYAVGATIALGSSPFEHDMICARLDYSGIGWGVTAGATPTRSYTISCASSSDNVKLNVVRLDETADAKVLSVGFIGRIQASTSGVSYPTLTSLNIGPIYGIKRR